MWKADKQWQSGMIIHPPPLQQLGIDRQWLQVSDLAGPRIIADQNSIKGIAIIDPVTSLPSGEVPGKKRFNLRSVGNNRYVIQMGEGFASTYVHYSGEVMDRRRATNPLANPTFIFRFDISDTEDEE